MAEEKIEITTIVILEEPDYSKYLRATKNLRVGLGYFRMEYYMNNRNCLVFNGYTLTGSNKLILTSPSPNMERGSLPKRGSGNFLTSIDNEGKANG